MAAFDALQVQTERYYSGRFRAHGATPSGVDWKSEDSQRRRFDQLLRIVDHERAPFSLNDYGCGYGALVDHLRRRHLEATYCGFDLSQEMVESATERLRGDPACRFTTQYRHLAPADYAVASGVFNVKLETPREAWEAYVLACIREMAAISVRGFSFNVLSLDSDPARRRPDLYYGDPAFFLDHCRTVYSTNIALLQDYGLFEFTMVVRSVEGRTWPK